MESSLNIITDWGTSFGMVKIHRMSKKIDHSRHMACVTMGRALDEALQWADIHVYNHDQGIGWCWCSSLVTYQPHGVCEWCRTMNMTHMSVIAPTAHQGSGVRNRIANTLNKNLNFFLNQNFDLRPDLVHFKGRSEDWRCQNWILGTFFWGGWIWI